MANKIRELRTSLSLTQSELAAQLGLNQSAIGKYERGELEPNVDILKKLSAFFQCSIDYIVGNSDDFGVISISSPVNQTSDFSAEEQALIRDYRQLSPDLQEMLQATIRTWKGSNANAKSKRA